MKDPNYSSQYLFHYDVGVSCPGTFDITFPIPAGGKDTFNKQLKIEIEDTYRTIKITVFRPAPNVTQEVKGESH